MTDHEPRALRRAALTSFGVLAAAIVALALVPHPHVEPTALESMRQAIAGWMVIPFVLLLGAIAVMPLAAPHWWEHNARKAMVVAALAIPIAALLLFRFGVGGWFELYEKLREYVSFLMLLGALYVISGGIYVRGSLDGTPLLNTILMAIGAVIASFVGTTGASMLLIRPLLRANQPRERKAHVVVFFIFVVSNCGGLLTPLGDPPLFLGFLKGVPFEWTLARLWPLWLFVNAALLGIFFVLDTWVFNKEERERPGSQRDEVKHHAPLGIDGLPNLLLLLGVVAVVYSSGRGFFSGGQPWPFGVQEALMWLLAAASFFLTPALVHGENHFSLGPIVEVAVLFIGIFVTMAPALMLLNVHGGELGLSAPWQFFWATGILSSVLDNAPTYLTMAATGAGLLHIPAEGRFLVDVLSTPAGDALLRAISAGAVLMGANTYIGNGPNFMVKAVAEGRGVKMPSFFGYMAYSGAVLIPLFVIMTVLFFRG